MVALRFQIWLENSNWAYPLSPNSLMRCMMMVTLTITGSWKLAVVVIQVSTVWIRSQATSSGWTLRDLLWISGWSILKVRWWNWRWTFPISSGTRWKPWKSYVYLLGNSSEKQVLMIGKYSISASIFREESIRNLVTVSVLSISQRDR